MSDDVPIEIMNRREHHRFRVAIRAKISDSQSTEQIPCIIRDGSISGCKVVCDRIDDIADTVYLNVPKLKQIIKGKIVWREERTAGIEFEWNETRADERRGAPRREMFMPVIVCDQDHNQLAKCVILDASRTGCRIGSRNVKDFPERISVQIDGLTEPVMGRIVWRSNGMAGVAFFWQSEAYATDKSVYL